MILLGFGKQWSRRDKFGRCEAFLAALLPLSVSLPLSDSFSPIPRQKTPHIVDIVSPRNSLLSGDEEARSAFGTKAYWDELYMGQGDFPSDEYTWYFGFDSYQRIVQEYVTYKDCAILIPGIGNDPLLLDLLQRGYSNLTATDYSEHAIDRQLDLISFKYPEDIVELRHMDARQMDETWTDRFDVIIEKGALDAIYLSGDGNFERAVVEFERILKPGGVLISVSGVVPETLRREVLRDWLWERDGSDDLKAGCFVLRLSALK